LELIARQEGLTIEPAALDLIARHSTGALRDAISLLDQIVSYGDHIALDQVQMVLGAAGGEAAGELVGLWAHGDIAGGLVLIDRVVGDGVDARQFGREVVEYLRGLLLIKERAGARLLDATAEQAAEMEGLVAQLSTGQLLGALRLFNGAVTDLKGGLQTIPHLPLEMALVESTLQASDWPGGGIPSEASPNRRESWSASGVGGPSAERTPAPVIRREGRSPGAILPSAVRSTEPERTQADAPSLAGDQVGSPKPSQPKPSGRAVAEPAPVALASAPPEQPPGAVLYQTGPGLTLDQVQRRWPEIIGAVQALNRTTAAVLRSNCQPVDLADDQIVVTVPSAILRDKLENPQRKVEVQEAVSSVLGVRSRIRLVLEAEYAPRTSRPALQPQPQAATPSEASPGASAEWTERSESRPKGVPERERSGRSVSEAGNLPDQPAGTGEDQVPDEISRWAAERGGQATIVK